jgi:2-phospho-L-lactate guanylyltransferase
MLGPGARAGAGAGCWAGASVRNVQATVRAYSPETRSGTVLLDDGTELPYDGDAFAAGRMRLLRFGQRVRVEVEGDGADRRVTLLTLHTLPT